MAEYRIDELAQAAGSTVRNIRAYQDRGLLAPPRLEGRVGIYDDSHLARLRLIGKLLGRGYTFAVIKDLLSAWETGKDVGEVLGLEKVLTDPWSDEIPGTATLEELLATFGRGLPSGEVAAGIPLEAVLDIAERIRDDCDVIAGRFVDLVREHVFQPVIDEPRAGGDDIGEIAVLVRRMRPLVRMVVDPFIARSMEARVQEALGAQLEQIRDHLTASAAHHTD